MIEGHPAGGNFRTSSEASSQVCAVVEITGSPSGG
jgi:hypothetical protein